MYPCGDKEILEHYTDTGRRSEMDYEDYCDAMDLMRSQGEEAIDSDIQDMSDQEVFEYLTNGNEGEIMPEDWIGSAEYDEYYNMAVDEYLENM